MARPTSLSDRRDLANRNRQEVALARVPPREDRRKPIQATDLGNPEERFADIGATRLRLDTFRSRLTSIGLGMPPEGTVVSGEHGKCIVPIQEEWMTFSAPTACTSGWAGMSHCPVLDYQLR
jgi:hypothetical protein